MNDISRGTLVGTVSIGWDGAMATVAYSLAAGVVMTEAYLYARSTAPATIASWQHGHLESFSTPVSSHTFTVPLSGQRGLVRRARRGLPTQRLDLAGARAPVGSGRKRQAVGGPSAGFSDQ